MEEKYIVSIDQSTQGTKALLFDNTGKLILRADRPHRQLINEKGWVSHDPEEIYSNVVETVRKVTEKIDRTKVVGIGISNQRETSLAWDRKTGKPLADAIVWQCARAADICDRVAQTGEEEYIKTRTGMNLSPYFPASKIAWLLENVDDAEIKAKERSICHGTIDSWLIFKLTGGKEYKTDYSNASRTQLFDIWELKWSEKICGMFGIDPLNLPEVCDSDSEFGWTDVEGIFPKAVPIHAVMGDSHGALFGQGCLNPGMTKATYGTGSSIMMNIGTKPVISSHGVVTSLAWSIGGKVSYVLEGNLNYTGAVITWLKNDLNMIQSPAETEELAFAAETNDALYLVPAFSGLGAPYWDSKATASIVGMTRTTKRAEIVRAAVECIAYQITDILKAMSEDSGVCVEELRVDGGPTKNKYLMQFQSDISDVVVQVPDSEELSGIGPAYATGIALNIWDKSIFHQITRKKYLPQMKKENRNKKYAGWENAVRCVLGNDKKKG